MNAKTGLVLGSTLAFESYKFDYYDESFHVKNPSDLNIADAVVFWGGADIGTSIYKQTPNKFANQAAPSERDRHEIKIAKEAIKNGIPLIGVCRGAQLLCCIGGGSLLQHINGHGFAHDIEVTDEEKQTFIATSSHHQMMIPPAEAHVLAYGTHKTVGLAEFNRDVEVMQVPEIVYMPHIKALLIQPHPEWNHASSNTL